MVVTGTGQTELERVATGLLLNDQTPAKGLSDIAAIDLTLDVSLGQKGVVDFKIGKLVIG